MSSKKRIGGGSKPGTYAAQCVECMKWRKVPKKEVFEEIRELAETDPFMCEKAREWTEGSQLRCQDEPNLSPEGSERMWLMEKPCIPRPPNGWERLVYLRKNPTGNKFADVYYVNPCGKRLRSGTELAKFFDFNVHYKEQGIGLSQFNL